jgi:hypothetical protein
MLIIDYGLWGEWFADLKLLAHTIYDVKRLRCNWFACVGGCLVVFDSKVFTGDEDTMGVCSGGVRWWRSLMDFRCIQG